MPVGELTREEALARLKAPRLSKTLSRDEALAQISGAELPGKPSAMRSAVGGLLGGAAGVVDAFEAIGSALAPGGGILAGRSAPKDNPLADLSANIRGAQQIVTPPEERGRGTFLTEGVPETLGQMVPGVVAGAINPALGAAVFGAQGGGPVYFEVVGAGGTPEEGMLALVGNAGLAQLERLGAGGAFTQALRKLGGSKVGAKAISNIAAHIAVGGTKEVGTEALEQIGHDLIHAGLTGEEVAVIDNAIATVTDPTVWTVGALGAGAKVAAGRQGPQAAPAAPGARPPTPMAAQRPTEPIAPRGQPEAPAAQPAPVPPAGPALPPAEVPMLGEGGERGLVPQSGQPGQDAAPKSAQVSTEQGLTAGQEAAKNTYVEPDTEQAMSGQTSSRLEGWLDRSAREAQAEAVADELIANEEDGDKTKPEDLAAPFFAPGGAFESFTPKARRAFEKRVERVLGVKAGDVEWTRAREDGSIEEGRYESVEQIVRSHLRDYNFAGLKDDNRQLFGLLMEIGEAQRQHEAGTNPFTARAERLPPKLTALPEPVAEKSATPAELRAAGEKRDQEQAAKNYEAEQAYARRRHRRLAGIAPEHPPVQTEPVATPAPSAEVPKPPVQESAKFTPPEAAAEVNPRAKGAGAPTPEASGKVDAGGTPPPKKPRGGATEMFAGGPNPFGKSSNVSFEGIKRWAKKWLTSIGDKPRGVRREMELAEGSSKSEMIEVRRHARRLDAAMRKSDANWRATESADLVDAAFEGDKAAMEALPEEAQASVADMRTHLDRLIRSQVKAGGVIDPDKMPEFAKKILESQGSYARRSYRAYLDPNWADKVPADVRQRTHDLFRSWEEYAGATDAEIDAELDAILQKAKETTDNPWKAIAAGKLGRKDLSLYKRRKDIPSELRAFLGEVEDPIANYATSVFKIAQNVARHEAAVNIKKAGLGKFIFEKPTGDATAKLTAEGNRALAPLDGLYVTPELKEALTAISPKDMALWMKVASRLNGAIKWGKVIGQPWAFMRNLWGNVPMSIANGHLPAYFKSAEWKAAFGEGDLDTLKRLKRLGVIDDNISTYEWEDAKRAATATPEELAKGALDPGPVGKAQRFAERSFQAADNAPKIRFFLAEEAALKEAGYSAKEAESIASDRTRDLMPTPERMPEILRQFRKQPFLGSFFAFRAEVVRTTANRIKLISEELKSKNPKVRAMGRRRAAGQIAAATITPTLAYGLNMMLGTDAEDDEAKRNFLPPWDKNSRVLWLGDDLKGEYFDFSDLDPFTMGSDPALRVLAGGEPKDTIEGFVREELQSFVGPSPLTQLALDIYRREDKDGKPIDDMTAHILKQVQPGFVASARRVPETGIGGEAMAMVSGVRRYQFDVPKSLTFDAYRYQRLLTEAKSKESRQSKKDPEGAEGYLGEMETSRKEAFDEMAAKAQAAIRLGMSTDEVRKILRDILSAREVNAIIGGTYVPHRDTRKLK